MPRRSDVGEIIAHNNTFDTIIEPRILQDYQMKIKAVKTCKISRVVVGLSLLFLSLCASAKADATSLPPSILATKTITFCSAMTQPPFEFYDKKLKPEGVDIEMGELLASQLGLSVKWINVPFAGVIPALLAKHCDAVLSGLNITPNRLQMVDMVPYRFAGSTVLLKAGAPKLPGVEALTGKKVAVVTGTAASLVLSQTNDALLKEGKSPITLVTFSDNATALQQLQFGQVDAFGVAYETATYYDQIDPGQFEFGVPIFHKVRDGIAVRKDDTGLRLALASALSAVMKNNSYNTIYQKWHIGFDVLN
jgi:polar amino acid transport system substrate-binding protein